MKQLMLFSMVFVFTGFAHAQKLKASEVPAAIKQSFGSLFPKAEEVRWSKEGSAGFEAEFEIAGIEKSANFDVVGKWMETETEIKSSELPQEVQAALAKEFAGFKIGEVEKVESPEYALLYEMDLKKEKMTFEVQFSADGKLVRKEEKKRKKED